MLLTFDMTLTFDVTKIGTLVLSVNFLFFTIKHFEKNPYRNDFTEKLNLKKKTIQRKFLNVHKVTKSIDIERTLYGLAP